MSLYLWFSGICLGMELLVAEVPFFLDGGEKRRRTSGRFWGFLPQHQVVQNEVPSTAMYH